MNANGGDICADGLRTDRDRDRLTHLSLNKFHWKVRNSQLRHFPSNCSTENKHNLL